jgi:formate dehydrogenase subunit gamma
MPHDYHAWDQALARTIIAENSALDGAALPILHALQEAFGHVPQAALPVVADALNLSRAELHGIASFYHEFRHEPPGRRTLKLCRAEACQSMGGVELADNLLRRLQVGWGGRTADGEVTVEPVFCLGLCSCAPAALLDGEPVGRLTDQRLAELLG